MNKLMSIFGAIIFASFIMTSCGGASTEATPEASGDAAATTEAMAPEATAEVAAATTEAMAPEAMATEATADAKKAK
jgi:PBP1b-binding outer membrane lipoprotein LpoB